MGRIKLPVLLRSFLWRFTDQRVHRIHAWNRKTIDTQNLSRTRDSSFRRLFLAFFPPRTPLRREYQLCRRTNQSEILYILRSCSYLTAACAPVIDVVRSWFGASFGTRPNDWKFGIASESSRRTSGTRTAFRRRTRDVNIVTAKKLLQRRTVKKVVDQHNRSLVIFSKATKQRQLRIYIFSYTISTVNKRDEFLGPYGNEKYSRNPKRLLRRTYIQ